MRKIILLSMLPALPLMLPSSNNKIINLQVFFCHYLKSLLDEIYMKDSLMLL